MVFHRNGSAFAFCHDTFSNISPEFLFLEPTPKPEKKSIGNNECHFHPAGKKTELVEVVSLFLVGSAALSQRIRRKGFSDLEVGQQSGTEVKINRDM